MTKIFKYPIEPKDTVQTFDLPAGAEIVALRVMPQLTEIDGKLVNKEVLSFWAIVDPDVKLRPRRLMCVGTGWEIQPNIIDYIDTCVTSIGLVWHLLEVK